MKSKVQSLVLVALMSMLTSCHKEVRILCKEIPHSGKKYVCYLHFPKEGFFLVDVHDGHVAYPKPTEVIGHCDSSCPLYVDRNGLVTLYVWGGSEAPQPTVTREDEL
jgi:hypothetical protein